MRRTLAGILATAGLAFGAAPQGEAPKGRLSADPLTEEQIAVYRTVLDSYSNGSNAALNVADKTETLDLSEVKDCLKGIALEPNKTSTLVIHRLDDRLTKNTRNILLVDGEIQQKRVEENDPQKLIKRSIDDGEKVSEKELDESLDQAFKTGIFTFSEIVFDKQHQHAVLAYSFVCGSLCGSGNTIVLKRVGNRWKKRKTCRSWIS